MRYLEKRSDGSWRYQRGVPRELVKLVGTGKRIKRQIGRMGQRAAEEIAAGHAITDGRLFRHLTAMAPEEQAQIIAAGGWLRMGDHEAHLQGLVALPPSTARNVGPMGALVLHAANVVQQDAAAELARLKALRFKPRPASEEHNLDGLLRLWKRKKAPKRADQHERTIRELKTFLGGGTLHNIAHYRAVDYRDISITYCRAFRDYLEDNGCTVRAVENHLYALRGMFSAAVQEGTLECNPAETVRPNGKHQEADREAFTGEEMRTILSKAEATRLGGDRHEATMWAIRLAVWTGARPREIMQLRKGDVIAANGGPAHIHINEGHAEQSVKSGFARKVPLAPAVDGFVEWAHHQPTEFVFGCFPFNAQKGRAGWTGDTFSPFLRDVCGITSATKVFYSFRHRFTDLLERAGVPEIRQLALVGHGSKSVHRKYKTDPKLRELYLDVKGLKPFED